MNTIQGEGTSTLMKFFLLVTGCIIINVLLYLFEDKWIGGLFTGAWLLATLLSYLFNRGFDLNIMNYSMTTLLQKYFFPILTYLAWIGVIYWLITAQNDLSDNPDHSQLSRNFAGVMTGFIPVLAGIVTYYSTYSKPVGWAILYSIFALLLGSYLYYIFYNLLDDCNKNISKSSCWTFSANVTFLGFIIITLCFGLLSTIDSERAKYVQFLPRILKINPTSPLSIFSIITYLIMWISFIIVFFRHDSKFGDEEGDPVNVTFTVIGILMFILLIIKETSLGAKFINMLTYMLNQSLSTKLLHASIITTFIVSIYFTSIYLESKSFNTNINGIWALDMILSLLFFCYLVLMGWNYYKS